jgi:hypothetical protein
VAARSQAEREPELVTELNKVTLSVAELMKELMEELTCPLTLELMIDPVCECGSNSPHTWH